MKHKGKFKQWFNVFLVISGAWQGYKSKAYRVSNHHPKLQPKKFSRTRDISNFPTQGWADTAFYTSNWNRTYTHGCLAVVLQIAVKWTSTNSYHTVLKYIKVIYKKNIVTKCNTFES